MQLRQAYADVLLLLRSKKGLKQLDLATKLDASYISRLERGHSSVTLEASESIAEMLELQPVSLLLLAYAVKLGTTPRELLAQVSLELDRSAYMDADLAHELSAPIHPQIAKGIETTRAILALKAQGVSQAEAARRLGISTSTIGRHWNRKAD
jgi:transcriptional regulator with XRE-family HTH domain